MGGGQSNVYKAKQTVSNSITQFNQSSCIATVDVSSGGNTIISDGSYIAGDIIGSVQKISTDASCIMSNSNTANVQNILESMSSQTNSGQNGLFDFLSKLTGSTLKNQTDITQAISNNIAQINTATCSSNIISSTLPNYIYVKKAFVGGSVIGSTTDASATSSCTINNGSSAIVYNQELSKNDQTNKNKSLFFTIVIAFTVIMILIIGGVIILFATGAIGSIGYKSLKIKNKEKITKTPPPPAPTQPAPTPPAQPIQLQPTQPAPPPTQPTQLQPTQLQPTQLQPTQLQPLPQKLPQPLPQQLQYPTQLQPLPQQLQYPTQLPLQRI
jgi:hypothetical protein